MALRCAFPGMGGSFRHQLAGLLEVVRYHPHLYPLVSRAAQSHRRSCIKLCQCPLGHCNRGALPGHTPVPLFLPRLRSNHAFGPAPRQTAALLTFDISRLGKLTWRLLFWIDGFAFTIPSLGYLWSV